MDITSSANNFSSRHFRGIEPKMGIYRALGLIGIIENLIAKVFFSLARNFFPSSFSPTPMHTDAYDDEFEDEDEQDDFAEGFETIDDIENFDSEVGEEEVAEMDEDLGEEDAELDLQEERFFEDEDIDDEEEMVEEISSRGDEYDDNITEFVNDDLSDTDEDYYYGEYEE